MKKLAYLLAPLMCFSPLASCGDGNPKITKIYTVTFINQNTEFEVQEVKENNFVDKPKLDPVKYPSERETYKFSYFFCCIS